MNILDIIRAIERIERKIDKIEIKIKENKDLIKDILNPKIEFSSFLNHYFKFIKYDASINENIYILKHKYFTCITKENKIFSITSNTSTDFTNEMIRKIYLDCARIMSPY